MTVFAIQQLFDAQHSTLPRGYSSACIQRRQRQEKGIRGHSPSWGLLWHNNAATALHHISSTSRHHHHSDHHHHSTTSHHSAATSSITCFLLQRRPPITSAPS